MRRPGLRNGRHFFSKQIVVGETQTLRTPARAAMRIIAQNYSPSVPNSSVSSGITVSGVTSCPVGAPS